MEEQEHKRDEITASILKKGARVPSPDFTDRVMSRVLVDSEQAWSGRKYLRRSWMFLGVAMALLPLLYLMASHLYTEYFAVLHDLLARAQETMQYMFAMGLCLMIFLLLDTLAAQTFAQRGASSKKPDRQLV